jgi:hypothetical protein
MTIVYRILTYLLLPLGVIFAFLTLAALTASLGNVAALLPSFLCGSTVIYIITSLIFLQNGILGEKKCKPGLFDWIRVNGFVALFMGSVFIFQGIFLRGNAEISELLKVQMDTMTEQLNEADKTKMPNLEKLISGVLNFMLVSGLLLVIHIMLGFSVMKKYAAVFGR